MEKSGWPRPTAPSRVDDPVSLLIMIQRTNQFSLGFGYYNIKKMYKIGHVVNHSTS